jgi:hypothetical protein
MRNVQAGITQSLSEAYSALQNHGWPDSQHIEVIVVEDATCGEALRIAAHRLTRGRIVSFKHVPINLRKLQVCCGHKTHKKQLYAYAARLP